MKPSFDLASLPHDINDTDALSSLQLHNTIASGENQIHEREENIFL